MNHETYLRDLNPIKKKKNIESGMMEPEVLKSSLPGFCPQSDIIVQPLYREMRE